MLISYNDDEDPYAPQEYYEPDVHLEPDDD
jgi:hypothetical protein